MNVDFEAWPDHYEGDYPSITIHYRPRDRAEAERIRHLIETGCLDEDPESDAEQEAYDADCDQFNRTGWSPSHGGS